MSDKSNINKNKNGLKHQMADIVGSENVFDDTETLEAYSRDQSFTLSKKPRLVVKPKNADEVQGIVKWANQTRTPLVSVSSGPPRFRGDTIPSLPGAIIVDLSEMKRIIAIDRRNRMVLVEPGVTFGQLQPELAKEGLKLSMPLLPRISKSVLTSLLEREPILTPKYQWQLPDPLRFLEVVWGNGESLRTGDAGLYPQQDEQAPLMQVTAWGPWQIDYYRLLSAAQGTLGIVTWAAVKCEILPQLHKLFFVPSKRLDDLLDFTYRLLRFRYGDELLILNNSNLSSILGEGADEIKRLRDELPQWVLILGVAGRNRLVRERVEFQEKDIMDIAQQFGLRLLPAVSGIKGGQLAEILSGPSKEPCWKLRHKGGCQDIFFLTTLDRTTEFVKSIYTLAQEKGYPTSDVGIYVQPVQQGVACHCEFNFPFDPGNRRETAKVRQVLADGSEELMKQGAFFSRPYGIWADMVYNRDAQTTITLKKIKSIFDPQNVMNPGKLCL